MSEQIGHLPKMELLQLGRIEQRAVRRTDPVAASIQFAKLVHVRHVTAISRPQLDRAEMGRQFDENTGLLQACDLVVHSVQALRIVVCSALG